MSNHSQSGQAKGQAEIGSILQQTRIILVEPAGPLNIGSIARVMKNFGLRQLVLVRPQCDPCGDQARQMAVHAQDVLLGAIQVETLNEALEGCHYVMATTGRSDAIPFPLVSPRDCFAHLQHPSLPDRLELALLFGREDRGLTHAELCQAHQVLEIPTSEQYASLNLAQAVGVCCYELFQAECQAQTIAAEPLEKPSVRANLPLPQANLPATWEQLEGYYQQLEHLLLRIGYLYPHTANRRMEKFRHLYQRANLSDREVAMLRGILRQTEWALQQR
ncbi:MAG: RNA methyltransferase [Prochlorotrichaceae cyanobacterium]